MSGKSLEVAMIEDKTRGVDWRRLYVVCWHVAWGGDMRNWKQGTRACCTPCLEQGFLSKRLTYDLSGDFVVGTILPKGGGDGKEGG